MYKCVRDVCRFFQNVNISFEIFVNVLQMNQNVNISFEICVNVFQLIQNVNISLKYVQMWPGLEICANFQWVPH